MALCMSLYCFACICVYGMEVKISVQLVKEETSGASVINLSLSDSEAVGRSLPVVNKQIGVDSCRSPGHVRLSVCLSLSACFSLADMHGCVFIHKAATIAIASSFVFIYISKSLDVFKLFHSEEIHQAGVRNTTKEQRSIESSVHIRENNGCWIIEPFQSHRPFVPGLMGWFSTR